MKPTNIIIHHVAFNHSFYTVNNYHKQKWRFRSKLGWYIGYQWFIDTSGKLFQGRREDEEGAHAKGWNTKSIGICLRGNLETTKPTNQQIKTLQKLLDDIIIRWDIPKKNIYGHMEIHQTLCPGKYLMPFIKKYREEPIEKPEEEPIKSKVEGLAAQLEAIKKIILALKQKIQAYLKKL